MAPALQVVSPGHPTQDGVLKVIDQEAPSAGPGEVVVRMVMAAVNPADGFTVMGVYPGVRHVTEKNFPFCPGLEGVGVVHAVGDGVTAVKEGQRVVPVLRNEAGSWGAFVKVTEQTVVPIPDGLKDEYAAQLFVNPLTAYGMLDDCIAAQKSKEDWVIQTAATSTLGRMFINMAKSKGVKVLNVVRRKEAVDEIVNECGGDAAVVFDQGGDANAFAAEVAKLTGGARIAAVVDAVGGDTGTVCIKALAPKGQYYGYGMQSGETLDVNVGELIFKDIDIHGWWLSTWFARDPAQSQKVLGQMIQSMAEGVVTPEIGPIVPITEYQKAMNALYEKGRKGKVLLKHASA
eukprot:Clim_evm9s236 gene=Clim_evmTU9s236